MISQVFSILLLIVFGGITVSNALKEKEKEAEWAKVSCKAGDKWKLVGKHFACENGKIYREE